MAGNDAPAGSAELVAADAAASGGSANTAIDVQTPATPDGAQTAAAAGAAALTTTLAVESGASTARAPASNAQTPPSSVVGSVSTPATAGAAEPNAAAATTAAVAAAGAKAAQTASAEPPRSQVPPPPPRIAVVALGDSAITGPARQRIEEQLIRLGFDVVDSELLDVDGGAPLPQLFRQIRRQAAAVVVVRAEPIGSQELQYYGQSSTLYSVQLGVRAYAVGDQRPLGAGWRERVDFTTLNAEIKALESVEPRLDSVVDALSDYRPRRRS